VNLPIVPTQLAHTVHETDRTRLLLKGVLDASSAVQLVPTAVEALTSGKNVLVVMDEVEVLNTAALQVIVALGAELNARNRALSWEACRPEVVGFLELAGVEPVRTSD
jgi:anti-anti-sigma regulatory factor